MRRIVGKQVRVISQPDADRGQRGPDLVQVVRDQRAGIRVDGEPVVLVRLGVLADTLTTANDVIEGDVDQVTVEVDVADLQAAQLAAAHAGDHHQPQVQSQGGERFRRPASRPGSGGRTKAGCAVGRSILVIVWHLLNDPAARYHDLGPDWHARHTDRSRRGQGSGPGTAVSGAGVGPFFRGPG
jgi:hypothetical protein